MSGREQPPEAGQGGVAQPPPSADPADGDRGIKMKIKRTKSGRQEIVKSDGSSQNGSDGEGAKFFKPRDSSSSSSSSSSPGSPMEAVGDNNGGEAKHEFNGTAPVPMAMPLAPLTNVGLHQLTTNRLKVGIGST